MHQQIYGRVRRTIVRSAGVIAIGVAILAPVVFGMASYRGEARYLDNQTGLLVQNLTRFSYRFPETWVFQGERVGDVVSTSLFAGGIRVRVMDAGGDPFERWEGARLSSPHPDPKHRGWGPGDRVGRDRRQPAAGSPRNRAVFAISCGWRAPS